MLLEMGNTNQQAAVVSSTALQIPSPEAHNNMGQVQRCSSFTELTAQPGKVTACGKVHPENDPFGEAAQIWINPFWSGPRDRIKTSAYTATE